jgi:hypothetical protein
MSRVGPPGHVGHQVYLGHPGRLAWVRRQAAALLCAGACVAAWAQGPVAAPVSAACTRATEMSHLQLYGLWRAEFDGGGPGATLLLEKHPDYAESVRGGINRNGVKGLVSGDVDNGEFSLDESDDGTRIAASWTGTVVDDSCGKEIRGVWTPVSGAPRAFVLRKLPGWH